MGIHRLWKNHFVSTVLDPRGGIQVLDVAGGTGDIAMRILDHVRTRHGDRETSVKMLDINPEMLREGMLRFKKESMYWDTPQLDFQLGNAQSLYETLPVPEPTRPSHQKLPTLHSRPIADESIDLYTIAFGIRNCTKIADVLKEAYRVLKPGGVFGCLEFGKVTNSYFAEYVSLIDEGPYLYPLPHWRPLPAAPACPLLIFLGYTANIPSESSRN